ARIRAQNQQHRPGPGFAQTAGQRYSLGRCASAIWPLAVMRMGHHMFTRRFVGALAVFTAIGLGTVAAQQSAVIVMRSGERLNATLVDLSATGYQVRVRRSPRSINHGDVAAISFTGDGSDAQLNVVSPGNAVVVPRTGQRITGELCDIGGTSPLRITIRNSNGERDVHSNEV